MAARSAERLTASRWWRAHLARHMADIPRLPADGRKATRARMVRLAKRRKPYFIGEAHVDSGGWVTVPGDDGELNVCVGHVLAPGGNDLSPVGQAVWLGVKDVVEIKRNGFEHARREVKRWTTKR